MPLLFVGSSAERDCTTLGPVDMTAAESAGPRLRFALNHQRVTTIMLRLHESLPPSIAAAQLPYPYNDQRKYGIVPIWGYGEVTESKVDGLQSWQLI